MPMEWITVKADNIDGAAERIIDFLEHTDKAGNVIYFYGWAGWGASAVLKEVAKRLTSSSGWAETGTARGLGKIINIDFLRWQSKRSLQKQIAEELKLPNQVMALFDLLDEKDDLDGVKQSARGVIPYVRLAIMNELSTRRFLVILYNGSGSYIDLWEVGVPVIGDLGKRVLWTSRGRFWHHLTEGGHGIKKDVEELAGLSDIAISAVVSGYDENDATTLDTIRHLVYAEAAEVAKCIGVPEPDMSQKIVVECILYRALIGNDHNISWECHASNCWVCDGIIQDAADGSRSAWEIGDVLQMNMNLDLLKCCVKTICELLEQWKRMDHWVSVTSQTTTEVQVPSQATSFFLTGGGLEACMFEHSNKTSLRVLHLSHCTFSFSSPPFLSCRHLRFLLLDHCKNKDAQDDGEENNCHHHSHHSQENGGAWFQNLWVLELSYTDWYWLLSKDMLDLMSDLRELNVKGVGNQSMSHLHRCSGPGSNSRNKLLKLRVVAESYKDHGHDGAGGDRIQQVSPMVASFPDLSSWHILKTIVLDGCGDLEIIGSDAFPLSLESFSLTSNVTTKIKSVSFRGCTQLKSLLLRGLFDSLEELDMSGTAINTLDLSATQAKGLKRLVLLGCEKLHAIVWPQEKKYIYLEVLRIDTSTLAEWDREDKSHKREATSSDNTSVGWSTSATLCDNSRALIGLDWYISLRDPRVFGSLLNLRYTNRLHIEISSAGGGHKGSTNQGSYSDGGGRQQVKAVDLQKPTGSNLYYDDDTISTFGSNSQSGGGASNGDVFEASGIRNMWIWQCPPVPRANYTWVDCYISIQDDEKHVEPLQGTTTRQLPRDTTLPCFVNQDAKTLHLHDNLSISCLPGPTPAAEAKLDWHGLKWCRLERCPNLEGIVFTAPSPRQDGDDIFEYLETFWASQLPKARYIWDWSISAFRPGEDSFENLMFLHLDYCPRLVHVLPLYTANTNGCCKLKTLEIVCCSDLREVFPSDLELQQQQPRKFARLKRIHLYELPKLQRICGHRMLAPNLKTVKIRGCWGLKRLPAVRVEAELSEEESSEDITPPSTVDLDCEKEWWDNLEWDGEEAGHHPSHYKPTYSA